MCICEYCVLFFELGVTSVAIMLLVLTVVVNGQEVAISNIREAFLQFIYRSIYFSTGRSGLIICCVFEVFFI